MHHPLHMGKYFLPGLAIVLAVFLVDQYTKWVMLEAVARINGPESTGFLDWLTTIKKIEYFTGDRETFTYMVVTPFLNLVLVWNQGISFGLFSSTSPNMAVIFMGLSLLIAMAMLMWMAFSRDKLLTYALALIVGGALGNAFDRVRFDAVEDFIDFHVAGRHWPAFNLADAFIVIGAGLLLIHSFWGDGKKTQKD